MSFLIASGHVEVTTNTREAEQGLERFLDKMRRMGTEGVRSFGAVDEQAQDLARTLGRVKALGNIRVRADLDDRAGSGIASVVAAIRALKRESPIQLRARFDGSATQLIAMTQAMRDLNDSTARTGTPLTQLAARAVAAAAALQRLDAAAQDASRSLTTLRGRAAATADAMRDLNGANTLVSNSLRTINTRSGATITRFDDLSRTTRTLAGDMDDFGGSTDSTAAALAGLRGGLGQLTAAGGEAGSAIGGGGSSLRGMSIGAAGALGASLLPSIGAVAPMLTGLAVVGGGAALAMDDLKDKAKQLKKPFEEWQKVANEAVAPHTEEAVKSLKGAMKDLNPVIEIGAESFGRIVEKAAAFADSPAFKGALAKNAEMGAQWVEEFAGSVGKFTQSFLDFGTKSKPALDAWQNLLGGMLDTGLPSMFKELEQGIGGSSDVVNGLASLLNESLLPSLGKISGSFADAFGPLIGELLIATGDNLNRLATVIDKTMEGLAPFAHVAADGVRALNEVMDIGAEVAGSFASSVGGALFESLASVAGVDTSGLGRGFRGLSDWVKANEGTLRASFYNIAEGITTMVSTGISALPHLFSAFRTMTEGMLTGIDGLVSTLAATFGELPVVGDTFKDWNRDFDATSGKFREALDTIGGGINSLANEAIPRLNRAQVKMNVDEASQNLASIKEQLKDPELTKERRAKLSADKREAEQKLAAAKRELAALDRKKATVLVGANTNQFTNAVGGLVGRTLGTSYINVAYRKSESNVQAPFRASGGPVRGYAGGGDVQYFPNGGYVQGPGGPMSDSIHALMGSGAAARVSDTEYVVRARAVEKYGVPFMDALNAGSLRLPGFAKGGKLTAAQKAEQQRQKEGRGALTGDVTFSTAGKMAGFKNAEMMHNLGMPDSVNSLAGAINKYLSDIKKAFTGKQESQLVSQMMKSGKALLDNQKKLESVNKSLDAAKGKLDDLKGKFDQLKTSVSSSLVSFGNITKVGKYGTSPETLIKQLQSDTTRTTQFAGMLEQLKGKGLNATAIGDIAAGGVAGGGMATAQSLLNATPEQIKHINELQAQLQKSADKAGTVTADAMYGAGVRAAEGLVKGLTKQQGAIEAAMMSIAKSMEAAIKKALGIKSPAKVMEPIGDFAFQGVEQGWVKRAAAGSTLLSGSAAGLRVRPALMTGASSAATPGGAPVVVHLTANFNSMAVPGPAERKAFVRELGKDINDVLLAYQKQRRR